MFSHKTVRADKHVRCFARSGLRDVAAVRRGQRRTAPHRNDAHEPARSPNKYKINEQCKAINKT